jgi:hypothetical protein
MTTTRIAGDAVALLTGLSLAACGAPAPAVNASPPATSATPAAQAPVTPAPAPAAPAAIKNWCGGTGWTDWQAVSSDMSQLHTDSSDGNLATAEVDGSELATSAQIAGTDLPPFMRQFKADYGLAMAWLVVGGRKLASGNISGASSALHTANGYIGDVGFLVTSACT